MVNGAGLPWPPWTSFSMRQPAGKFSGRGRRRERRARCGGGFESILSDTNVRAVLINISAAHALRYCCQRRCGAAKTLRHQSAYCCSAQGNQRRAWSEDFKDSGLNFEVANDMKEAAEKVVAAANRSRTLHLNRNLHVDFGNEIRACGAKASPA